MCTIENDNDLCKGLLEASSGIMVSVAESCGRDARVTSRVGAHKKIWRATRSWCWGQGSRTVPLTYTPAYLAEKILTSRSALEGERKQVTVLFADLKGSMELLAERDPEEARQLLDPVLECMMAAVLGTKAR
jgi:class 3 adenylate cyclase